MPGLGLGAGLNRRQQNRFNAAAQQGQGQQWLAARPNLQQRTAGNQAVQNFAATGQAGPNAAPRFQPGGARAPGGALAPGGAPQGSGATGSQKGPGAGGGGQQAGGQAMAGGGGQPSFNYALQPGGVAANQALANQMQYQAGGQLGSFGQQGGFQQYPQQLGGITQGPASLGYQPGYTWQGSGYGPSGGQAGTLLGQMGTAQNMGSALANQGAGAANPGSAQSGLQQGNMQQMNPQLMQALLSALYGQQR